MKIVFSEQAWEDFLYWYNHNQKFIKKINNLLKEIARDPLQGAGKPERLKYELSGYLSRRLDKEHRLIYRVDEDCIYIAQCETL